ncbi:MAG: hypothetical protein II977_07695 [Oscillospiraceae bacterium]|nr:hypothetical protein [Oscillospiraceae bacterium]
MKTILKKLSALLLVFALMFSLAGCGGKDNGDNQGKDKPARPAVTQAPENVYDGPDCSLVRDHMDGVNYIAAAAFLGYYEYGYELIMNYLGDMGISAEYPFLEEIPEENFIDAGGDELYCVVPAGEDYSISVYEWLVDEYNDYEGEPGNALFHSDNGQPVFIKCNESDLYPNVLVSVEDSNGNITDYNPCLSGMDGRLDIPFDFPGIMDFSMYGNIDGGAADVTDTLCLYDSWTVDFYNDSIENIFGEFSFNYDGTAELHYGIDSEEYDCHYAGVYYYAYDSTLPDDAIIVELYAQYTPEAEIADELHFAATFEQEELGDSLTMVIEDGDEPFYGVDYGVYVMAPAMG